MFTKRELQNEIDECLREPSNYTKCEKLATYLTIYDHLYADEKPLQIERLSVDVVQTDKTTELAQAINNKSIDGVINIFDELLEIIKLSNQNLYTGVLQNLSELD